jgi:hypothetical protein
MTPTHTNGTHGLPFARELSEAADRLYGIFIRAGDKLIVMRRVSAAWKCLPSYVSKWLKEHPA